MFLTFPSIITQVGTHLDTCHTTQNGQNTKWTKILTLEKTIFGLKLMVKSGLDFFYFEILRAPSELLLPSAKQSAENG